LSVKLSGIIEKHFRVCREYLKSCGIAGGGFAIHEQSLATGEAMVGNELPPGAHLNAFLGMARAAGGIHAAGAIDLLDDPDVPAQVPKGLDPAQGGALMPCRVGGEIGFNNGKHKAGHKGSYWAKRGLRTTFRNRLICLNAM
jgi:hypothetical protein